MAEAQLPPQTDREKQCLERIAETSCADILRKVIECKVGSTQCSLFCQRISEECPTLTPNQRQLLCSGNISTFDAALCTKLARKIEGINPNGDKWNSKVADDNHSLFASIQRIDRFRKKVFSSADDEELSFAGCFHLITTAFEDVQKELTFERNFPGELDDIRNQLLRQACTRLSSRVETDATVERPIKDSTDSDTACSRLPSRVEAVAIDERPIEDSTDSDIEFNQRMAEAQLPPQTDREKQCLERIAETSCADILRKVIECKVGSTQCSLFCQRISEECPTLTPNQRQLLCSGNISTFDAALCTKLARKIEGINPNGDKWNSKVADDNHSLFASIQRIDRFRKKVFSSADDEELSFAGCFHLITTAFEDVQKELTFERNFPGELDDIRNQLLRQACTRLSSRVETDATVERPIKDSTDSDTACSRLPSRVEAVAIDERPIEDSTDSDIDLEIEYSFLYRFSREVRVKARDKIRLIRTYKDRFPPDLKTPQSDVMVVYNKNDHDAAESFRQSINDIELDLGNEKTAKVKAVLYDDQRFPGSDIGAVDECYLRSTYAFLYLTKAFVDNDYNKLVAESLLMDSIKNKDKKWSVVPINTSPSENMQYRVPLGINALKSENICKQDEFYWDRMNKLLSNKIHERKDREIEMFDKEYNEALRIQREDENHARAIQRFDEMTLEDAQSQQVRRPRNTVRPMTRIEDSESARGDGGRTESQTPSSGGAMMDKL